MDKTLYAEKLKAFNSTEKYKAELDFLIRLLGRDLDASDYVLDYGCGLGAAMVAVKIETFVNVMGYDTTQFIDGFTYSNPKAEEYQTVYFMHSLAHIENVQEVLKELMTDNVVVITPNAEWMDLNKNDHYVPDPTVVKHFSQIDLIELFESAGYKVDMCGQFGEPFGGQNERLFLSASKLR